VIRVPLIREEKSRESRRCVRLKFFATALAIVATVALGSALASAQTAPTPVTDQTVPTTTLEGTVTNVNFVNCGSTADTCQAIVEVAPGSPVVNQSGERRAVANANGTTIIIVPGTHTTWGNSDMMLTHLSVGDQVRVDYRNMGNMNVATSVTVTGRAKGGQ
jgi:hypothetical protein